MLEELKNNIIKSQWEEECKQRLLAVLPNLQKNYLQYLWQESYKLGFDFTGESLSEAVTACILAEQKLINGDDTEVLKILSIAAAYAWWENGNFVYPWVLDLMQVMRSKMAQEVKDGIADFLLKIFKKIKKDQIIFLLEEELIFSLSNHDLLMELKSYLFNEFLLDEPSYIQDLLNALQKNEEKLGDKNVNVGGKVVPANIKNLIKDFLLWSPKGAAGINTFQIVQYSKSSKNFLLLDSEQKHVLLEIIKIYSWLLKPVVSKKEIQEYQDVKTEYINSQVFELPVELLPIEDLPSKRGLVSDISPVSQIQAPSLTPRATVNESLSTPEAVAKPIPNVLKSPINKVPDETKGKIDKKLKELEKRVDFIN